MIEIQPLDLIYYVALDSGHPSFWNGTSQHKLEHTDDLRSLPLKMKIKRIDIFLESNVSFNTQLFWYLRLGDQQENDALIYEGYSIADIVGGLAGGANLGNMFLLDGINQFYTMGMVPVADDVYQVHTFHTDVFIDMAKNALFLDFGLQSYINTAYPAASGDLALIVVLGVEIL